MGAQGQLHNNGREWGNGRRGVRGDTHSLARPQGNRQDISHPNQWV